MDNNMGFLVIIAVCTIVLLIVGLRKKSELAVNFILRCVFGIIGIYFINQFLLWQQVDIAVGINPLTVLTSGTLGFPGVILLYGINLYKFL